MFGDEVEVKCNAVHGNRGDGIHIDQEFPVLVKDNSVTCNAGNGLITSEVGEVNLGKFSTDIWFYNNAYFEINEYRLIMKIILIW